MRELIFIDRETVTKDGRCIIQERRYSGVILEDGSYQPRSIFGKRFVMPQAETKGEDQKKAA